MKVLTLLSLLTFGLGVEFGMSAVVADDFSRPDNLYHGNGCKSKDPSNRASDVTSGPFQPTWASLKTARPPHWWDAGKFGIFIHWGAYSVAGFEPGGKGYAEHFPKKMYDDPAVYFPFLDSTFGGHPPAFGYKDIVPLFKAEQWDPAAWATLFRQAGARYVILTAEHHDGFALWDSDLTPWCATQVGPHRDLVGDLANAVRAAGLKYGVSYHRSRHTGFFAVDKFAVHSTPEPDVVKEVAEVPESRALYGPFSYTDAFIEDYVKRWKELQRKYHPAFMWLDDIPILYKAPDDPQTKKFKAVFRPLIADYLNAAQRWGKAVYFNNKGRHLNWPPGVGPREKDNLSMDSIGARWQDPATMGTSYGYMQWEEQYDAYKSPTELIHILCDVVSKNGNLLLNIGPRSDGIIPEGMRRRLRAIGAWLETNGEAIYGTHPWRTYGESHGPYLDRHYYNKHCVRVHRQEFRYTVKDSVVYAIALTPPAGPFVLESFQRVRAGQIVAVALVQDNQTVPWTMTPAGLQITPPGDLPFNHASVFKITLADSAI